MKTTSAILRPRPSPAWAKGAQRGAILMFVLLTMLIVAAITVTVMHFINADIAEGIREQQGVQVFNIAEAGVHYAIGQLQLSGGAFYTGGTLTVTSGSTTLGTATITVNCIDSTPSTPLNPPCTSSTYPGYRRIISTGTLPVSGPSRTVVAEVAATTGGAAALCAWTNDVDIAGGTTVYSNVASNGTIIVSGGSPPGMIGGDPNTPQQYTGTAIAVGTITCGSSCATQVAGGTYPNQSTAPCPTLTAPTFSPGSTPLSVPTSGYTMNSTTGYTWGDVNVAAGTCSGSTPYTDLNIQADPSNPNAVQDVQINTLTMGSCSRLMILGVGKIRLLIGKAGHNSLLVNANSRFGVLSTDTQSTMAPVPPQQLVVWDNSNGTAGATTAVQFNSAQLVSATILAPNGRIYSSSVPYMYGAFWAVTVSFMSGENFWSNTAGLPASAVAPYANFKYLMSWKDQ